VTQRRSNRGDDR